MEFILKDLPLAPSVNQYLANFKGRLIKTKIHREYSEQINFYIAKNRMFINEVRRKLAEYIEQPGACLRVDSYHCFEHSRLWTKDGVPKILDANNRLKPTLDGVAIITEVDDKYYFSGNVEKVVCANSSEECSIVHIYPVDCRTKDLILTNLEKFRMN